MKLLEGTINFFTASPFSKGGEPYQNSILTKFPPTQLGEEPKSFSRAVFRRGAGQAQRVMRGVGHFPITPL